MATPGKRLEWLDISKGIAILWIAFFHLFNAWWGNAESIGAGPLLQFWYTLVSVGFHGVGMFLMISGWSLAQSCARQEQKGAINWMEWYRKKLFRLFPLYWVAHLAFLVFFAVGKVTGVPFVEGFEALDSRFFVSLTGIRIYDIQSNFFYLNAAWWYFTTLIQLYLVFPLIYMAMRRAGVWPVVLAAMALGLWLRHFSLIQAWHHEWTMWFSDGMWAQGGFGLCRLPEFALGILLGEWHRKHADAIEKFLLNGPGLVIGAAAYPFAMMLYHGLSKYVFVDLATGICFFLLVVGAAGLLVRLGRVGAIVGLCGSYSYGIYLLHQPHVNAWGVAARSLSAWPFAVVSLAILVFVSVEGIWVEKRVNALMSRLMDGKPARA